MLRSGNHVSRATKYSKQEQQALMILPAHKEDLLRLGVCGQLQYAMAGLTGFLCVDL